MSIFESVPGPERDVITDFEQGIDKIDLAFAKGAFIGLAAFTGVAGPIRTFATSINAFVEFDGDGDRITDFQILLGVAPC